jgi:hypothetical protein
MANEKSSADLYRVSNALGYATALHDLGNAFIACSHRWHASSSYDHNTIQFWTRAEAYAGLNFMLEASIYGKISATSVPEHRMYQDRFILTSRLALAALHVAQLSDESSILRTISSAEANVLSQVDQDAPNRRIEVTEETSGPDQTR